VRYFAIRAVAALNQANMHVPDLIAAARGDSAMQVRIAAIEALGACGEGAFPILAELATSPVAELAQAAVSALPRTRHPQALTVVAQQLTRSTAASRQKAVQALAGSEAEEAVDILRPIALGTESRLALEAVASLGRIRLPSAATVLVEALGWPTRRRAAIEALLCLRDVATVALEKALAHPSLDVRRAVVETLSRIRTAGAIAALEAALRDDTPAVRHAALTALAHLSPEKNRGATGRTPGGRP
jgi:HEAT repeat protein